MWTVAQQPGRKLTPAVSTTRRRDGEVQGRQDLAEVRFRTRLDPQSIFNQNRHLNHRDIFKQNRSAALSAWRQLAA
jgi:hypothetical protein